MRTHDHAHEPDAVRPAAADLDVPAGKRTLTAGLAVERPVLASGLVQRKAERDDNGVAADAAAHVDRAASSSGAPLPEDLRARFEASLGADLSGVRVHTGAASATAAHAVGARAYTVGQDIHFGAGHFNPSSASGQHLLAHEVAHTVQQAGAASPGAQFKLEVSTPADAAEHEADRAADAMVAGAPARVSSSSPGAFLKRDQDASVGDDGAGGAPPVGSMKAYEEERHTEPPVKPRNWGTEIAPRGAGIDHNWAGAPAYSETPAHPKLRDGQAAFSADWAAAVATWNAAESKVAAYNKATSSAESATAGLPVPGQLAVAGDETRLPGSDTTVGETFKGDKLDVKGDAPYDHTKVDQGLRQEIVNLRTQLEILTENAVNAHGDVGQSFANVEVACNNATTAVNNVSIAKNDKETVQWEQDIKELGMYKAAASGAIQSVTSIVKGAFAEKGKGLGDIISGVGKLVETGSNLAFDHKINQINEKITGVKLENANLRIENAVLAVRNAMIAIKSALLEVQKRNTAFKAALAARQKAYTDLSMKLKDAASKGGASPEEAARIQAAVQAVPFLEDVIGKCADVAAGISPPSYSEPSGYGAAQASNVGDFVSHVSVLTGFKQVLLDRQKEWEGRLASVNKLIGAAS